MEKPIRPLQEDGKELFDELLPVASATECTGLIPAAPESEAQATAYSEIYDIPLSEEKCDAAHNMQSIKKTKKKEL